MECPECGYVSNEPDENNFYDCLGCKCVFTIEGIEEHGESYECDEDDKSYDMMKEGEM